MVPLEAGIMQVRNIDYQRIVLYLSLAVISLLLLLFLYSLFLVSHVNAADQAICSPIPSSITTLTPTEVPTWTPTPTAGASATPTISLMGKNDWEIMPEEMIAPPQTGRAH